MELVLEGLVVLEDFYILGLVFVDVILQGVVAVRSLLLDILREREH